MDSCAFYDGKSTRRWEIELRREGDELLIRHPEWELRIPLDDINLERVPGGGGYVLHLASGGRCEVEALSFTDDRDRHLVVSQLPDLNREPPRFVTEDPGNRPSQHSTGLLGVQPCLTTTISSDHHSA